MRQDDFGKNLQAAGSERRCGFFQFFFKIFQHWLHGAHHKRNANKNKRNHHPCRYKRQLDAQRFQVLAQPAVTRQQGCQRYAGHRSGQRKRQIDQCINDFFAGKGVAHQHPGQQQAKHQIDKRGNQRCAKRQAIRRQHAFGRDGSPELIKRQTESFKKQR